MAEVAKRERIAKCQRSPQRGSSLRILNHRIYSAPSRSLFKGRYIAKGEYGSGLLGACRDLAYLLSSNISRRDRLILDDKAHRLRPAAVGRLGLKAQFDRVFG